jgi:hypothetical protein
MTMQSPLSDIGVINCRDSQQRTKLQLFPGPCAQKRRRARCGKQQRRNNQRHVNTGHERALALQQRSEQRHADRGGSASSDRFLFGISGSA